MEDVFVDCNGFIPNDQFYRADDGTFSLYLLNFKFNTKRLVTICIVNVNLIRVETGNSYAQEVGTVKKVM